MDHRTARLGVRWGDTADHKSRFKVLLQCGSHQEIVRWCRRTRSLWRQGSPQSCGVLPLSLEAQPCLKMLWLMFSDRVVEDVRVGEERCGEGVSECVPAVTKFCRAKSYDQDVNWSLALRPAIGFKQRYTF